MGAVASPPITYTTEDLSIAAFLCLMGCRVRSVQKTSKRWSKYFLTSVSTDPYDLAIQYIGSELARYDLTLRSLKKVVFGDGRGHAGKRGNWSTNNIPMAAFICARGGLFVGYRKVKQQRREYELYFDGETEFFRRLVGEFYGSDCYRYDEEQKSLKSMANGSGDNQ